MPSARRAASLLLLGALALVGCGGGVGGLCDDVCECAGGCTDDERDECIDELEDGRRAAEAEGCEEQADDWIDCAREELECDDEVVSFDGCEDEAEEVLECTDGGFVPGAGGVGNPCEELVARARAGGCLEEGVEIPECTGEIERTYRCFLQAVDDPCQLTAEEQSAVNACLNAGNDGGGQPEPPPEG